MRIAGLANRNLLSERLDDALKMALRQDKKVAVMLLDLDKFKPVNDLYGHSTGDKLLKVVAERLLNCAREVDTVARLGGDEFAIVFTNIEEDNSIISIADRIIDSIQQPTEIDGNIIQIDTSIGISFFPDDAAITDAVIRLGHSLGLTVVAEGVEIEEHVKILQEKGCDIFQGYYFCRPIDYNSITEFQKKSAK